MEETILDEIEKEAKDEAKYNKMVKVLKIGGVISFIVLAIFLGENFYTSNKESKSYQEGSRFLEIFGSNTSINSVLNNLEESMSGDSIYSTLSAFEYAKLNQNDVKKSIYAYTKILQITEKESSLHQFAYLTKIQLELKNGSITKKDAIDGLKNYISHKHSIFRRSARTMLLTLLIASKDYKEAEKISNMISMSLEYSETNKNLNDMLKAVIN